MKADACHISTHRLVTYSLVLAGPDRPRFNLKTQQYLVHETVHKPFRMMATDIWVDV